MSKSQQLLLQLISKWAPDFKNSAPYKNMDSKEITSDHRVMANFARYSFEVF